MERQPVKSSNIAEVGYDGEAKVLEIQFKSGAVHQYLGVPASLHAEMMAAESIGSFANKNIFRSGFESQRIDQEQDE